MVIRYFQTKSSFYTNNQHTNPVRECRLSCDSGLIYSVTIAAHASSMDLMIDGSVLGNNLLILKCVEDAFEVFPGIKISCPT